MGEEAVVRRLIERTAHLYPRRSRLPHGDDAAEVEDSGLVAKIDGYSSDFSRYAWEPWSDWGWRAVVASVSDLIAKGAKPLGVLVSLGMRGDSEVSVLDEIYDGVVEACEAHDLLFLGGDVNASSERAWINVAALGRAKRPVPRNGARPGDALFTTLKNGYGLTGLVWELHKRGLDPRGALSELPRLRPRAPLEFLELLEELEVTSSVDVSDGLAKSLRLIAEASGVDVLIDELPAPREEVARLVEEAGLSYEVCALYGGEEYETLFTSSNDVDEVLRACRRAGLECAALGVVVEASATPSVRWRSSMAEIEGRGYDQFRREIA
ncbi:MAG: thiamine-phosphate kinase [Fervidicoccaceae archaeon]